MAARWSPRAGTRSQKTPPEHNFIALEGSPLGDPLSFCCWPWGTRMGTLWDVEAGLTCPMGMRREYVKIGGDLVVGSLLSQVVYWSRPSKSGQSKLRVERDGLRWIAKTREQWMEECCLTRKEYIRAIKKLVDLGVVEQKFMAFGGGVMTHIRLQEDRLLALLQGESGVPKGDEGCTLSVQGSYQKGTPLGGPVYQKGTALYTEITSSEITTKTNSELALAKANSGEPMPKTAGEILDAKMKARTAKYGDPALKKPLGAHWQLRMGQLTHKKQMPLTMKVLGQLKILGKDVGNAAHDLIDYAFDNWWEFTGVVQAKIGISSRPTEPNIDFLVKHRQIVHDMFLQSIALPKPVAVKPPVPWPSPPPLKPKAEEKPAKMTQEQYEAVMAKFSA